MGRNQSRLLRFALRYPHGWHSCGPDSRRAMRSLVALGFLEVREAGREPQFRLALSRAAPIPAEPAEA